MNIEHMLLEESQKINKIAKKTILIEINEDVLEIHTKISDWKIILEYGKYLKLYHKNTRIIPGQVQSKFPGYHLQHKSTSTISGYLKYILKHDKEASKKKIQGSNKTVISEISSKKTTANISNSVEQ